MPDRPINEMTTGELACKIVRGYPNVDTLWRWLDVLVAAHIERHIQQAVADLEAMDGWEKLLYRQEGQ